MHRSHLKLPVPIQALVNQACQTQWLGVWLERAPDSALGRVCRITALGGTSRWDTWEGLLMVAVVFGGCSERAGMRWIRKWSYDLCSVSTGQLCSCPGASPHHRRVHRAAPDRGSNFGLFLHGETEYTGQSRAQFLPSMMKGPLLGKPSSAKNTAQISAPSPKLVSALSRIPACSLSCPHHNPLWDLPRLGKAPKQLTEWAGTGNL